MGNENAIKRLKRPSVAKLANVTFELKYRAPLNIQYEKN